MLMPPFAVLNAETTPPTTNAFAEAVREGLTRAQRELPSRYLYDHVGSALYEAITWLPEYGLSYADERLIARHADSLSRRLPGRLMVAELGSGSGRKTRPLLQSLLARPTSMVYVPIDISASALRLCRHELNDLSGCTIVPLERSYLDGLREAMECRPADHRVLTLFLGSTLGNFERPAAKEFLSEIRRILRSGDALLLGTDLEKPEAELLLAYDDPLGVTAAFNRNLLARVNRELHADFDLAHFHHDTRYDGTQRRIEMHLRSDRRQTVHVRDIGLTCEFQSSETIRTEVCHKFDLEELRDLALRCGFHQEAQWVDMDWPFAESLWVTL